MNEQLRRLIDLQRLDTLILSTLLRIDAVPAAISSHEGPLREAEAACERAGKEHESLEKRKKDREFQNRELQERIGRMRQRSSEIKTNKEYQAHLKEIEKAEGDLKSSEEDLLVIMTSMEESSKTLSASSSRVADEKEQVKGIREELQKEVLRCGEELKRLKADRRLLVEKVNAPVYTQYMTVMKACRGLAVVEAKNEICQGCNIHIPPQLFMQIKTNESITTCPQCRRILYFPSPEALS